MAVFEGGLSAALAEVGAGAQKGIHVIAKPDDAGALGHYMYAGQTGIMAAALAANSEIFQARWGDATRLCRINKIVLTGMRATLAFAAGVIDFRLTIARAFTVNGTGGTALTLTGNNQKMRTSFGTSLMSDMRIATTAALGAGTKTLDTQDIGNIAAHSSGGWNSATPIIGSIYLPTGELYSPNVGAGVHPIILAQNEGIAIRATVPATGTWNLGLQIYWSELTAY